MNITNNNKLLFGIAIALFIILIVLIFFTFRGQSGITGNHNNSPGSLTPTTIIVNEPTVIIPSVMPLETVPTFTPDQGTGVDITSEVVQQSRNEINKFTDSLPYRRTIQTSVGISTDVLINETSLQNNAWTLTIQVFNIDFQIPQGHPDYDTNRIAFLQSVSETFKWIQSQGANPSSIIIQWGDREFIQNRAEMWLENR